MPVWLRALDNLRIEEKGQLVTKRPGDWFQTGKMDARKFIAAGKAEIPRDDIRDNVRSLGECAVIITSDTTDSSVLGDIAGKLGVVENAQPNLPLEYTLIWDGVTGLTEKIIESGFVRLATFEGDKNAEPWEILAELVSDEMTAANYGIEEERDRTLGVISDLRVPVYSTSALWVRKTDATEAVIEQWVAEVEDGANSEHAFLRAIYTHHPMVCTLPAGWSQRFAWEG